MAFPGESAAPAFGRNRARVFTGRRGIRGRVHYIGAMNPAQVARVLAVQKDGDPRKFGEIAIALGFVTEAAIKAWEADKR